VVRALVSYNTYEKIVNTLGYPKVVSSSLIEDNKRSNIFWANFSMLA